MKPLTTTQGVAGSTLGRVPDRLPIDRLREYAGVYASSELEAAFSIQINAAGDLTLQRERDRAPLVLIPRDTSDTYSAGSLVLRFERDASGRVRGFTVDSGRVRGIVFERR